MSCACFLHSFVLVLEVEENNAVDLEQRSTREDHSDIRDTVVQIAGGLVFAHSKKLYLIPFSKALTQCH